jgi:hypothetical protein
MYVTGMIMSKWTGRWPGRAGPTRTRRRSGSKSCDNPGLQLCAQFVYMIGHVVLVLLYTYGTYIHPIVACDLSHRNDLRSTMSSDHPEPDVTRPPREKKKNNEHGQTTSKPKPDQADAGGNRLGGPVRGCLGRRQGQTCTGPRRGARSSRGECRGTRHRHGG